MKRTNRNKAFAALLAGLMLLTLLGGAPAKASATTEQPKETPAPGGPVLEVEDVAIALEGNAFSCSCRVDTEDGPAQIDYML